MVFVSQAPVFALYLCFLSSILVALPTARFAHTVQTLPARELQQSQDVPPDQTHRLRRRGLPGAVYICTQDNFRGSCAWTAPNDRCHIAGAGDDAARSIGPDENGFCILYEKATCTGTEVKTLRFPGLATDMPAFMSLKCFSERPRNNTTVSVTSAPKESGILAFSMEDGDPRLDGGVGSRERKRLGEIILEMERDQFSQGLIGLKKGHYY